MSKAGKNFVVPQVRNKQDFVNRFLQGEFGNRTQTWISWKDYEESDYKGLVCLRAKVPGGQCWYDLERQEAIQRWKMLARDSHYLSAMTPAKKTVFQGEVIQGVKSLDLLFSTAKFPMREALSFSSENVSGVIAQLLLESYLNPKSMDWLNHLFVTYPEHAIEFSTFSVCLGTLKGYNTIFWEVRKY